MKKNSIDPFHQKKRILTELCEFLELKLNQPYALELPEYLKHFEMIYPQLFRANQPAETQNKSIHRFKELVQNNDPSIKNSPLENPKNFLPPTGLSLLKQNASIIFNIKKEFNEEVKTHKDNMSYIKKNQNSQSLRIKGKVKSKIKENIVIIKRANNHYNKMLDLLFELNADLMYALPKDLRTTLTNRQNGKTQKDTFERNVVKVVYQLFAIDYLEKLRADIHIGDYLRKEALLEEEHKKAFIENRTVRILINSLIINHCNDLLSEMENKKKALERSLPILENLGQIFPKNNTLFDYIVQNCPLPATDTSIYAVSNTTPESELDIQPFVKTLKKKISNYSNDINNYINKMDRLNKEILTFKNQESFKELDNPTIKVDLENLKEWIQGKEYAEIRKGSKLYELE
ncbi:hypothetical protein AMD27_06300 [Acinetobacter sp. TGL-Y2]|uniref:hypothetical protein n=1 Tax=Acinetobacter sp. TGL-Y2 TaxID=1407071 RepID=UPI0007A66F2F|nr:hypothetical protein [Acinetobacter sp. TGL-Y2]AMW78531.1 hypothetical protein AMD27_06300 [Acinetobacter sp. TGL-Y2]